MLQGDKGFEVSQTYKSLHLVACWQLLPMHLQSSVQDLLPLPPGGVAIAAAQTCITPN